MRRVILIFTFMLLCSSQVSGIQYFFTRGELWEVTPKTTKQMYVHGVFEGLIFGKEKKIWGVEVNTEMSAEHYVDAIDVLYSDYKNVLIPVPFLLAVISLELSGASEEEVEALLQRLRKAWASSHAE